MGSTRVKFVMRFLHAGLEQRPCFEKTQYFLEQKRIQRESRFHHISMDTALFFEDIVHFYSYTRTYFCSRDFDDTEIVSSHSCFRCLYSDGGVGFGGILLVLVRRDVPCEALLLVKRLVAMIVKALKLTSFCSSYDAPLVHI